MRRKKVGGLSLTEVLISIAVISIGALGALSALSFGLFSTQQASMQTFAQSYVKKVIELVESGTLPYTNITGGSTIYTTTPPDTSTISDQEPWVMGGGGNWWPLDYSYLHSDASSGVVTNLWGWTGTPDLANWQSESPKYQRCITIGPAWASDGTVVSTSVQYPGATYAYASQLRCLTVWVRWYLRGTFKSLQTQTFFVVPAIP